MSGKKQKAKQKDLQGTKTLLVCVGCGGVFYHGLPRLATWCHRRGDVHLLLIDPDKVEERNAARQWGRGTGEYKTGIAMSVLATLGQSKMGMDAREVDSPEKFMSFMGNIDLIRRGNVKRIMVISTPDNHKCRVDVHEGCKKLAAETGIEVMEITGGNSMTDGYAYGCVHYFESKRKLCEEILGRKLERKAPGWYICIGDWTKTHPDIVDEAKIEIAREEAPRIMVEIGDKCGKCLRKTDKRAFTELAKKIGEGSLTPDSGVMDRCKDCEWQKKWNEVKVHGPQACGVMAPVGGDEQSMTGNQLTALCIWDLAEMMVAQGVVGEVKWRLKGDKLKVTEVWANLKER